MTVAYTPCHEKHKELPLSGFFGGRIIGANCAKVRPNYDLYIALDAGPVKRPVWNRAEYIDYPITNMSVPTNKEDFKLFIKWLVKKFKHGSAIHVGCIGGHGRTGLVLAAFVAELTGRKDAAKFIREHHCKSAIESKSQMDFLVELYGLDRVPIENKYYENQGSDKGGIQTTLNDSWDDLDESRKAFAGGWENNDYTRSNRTVYPKKTRYRAAKKKKSDVNVHSPVKQSMSLWT